MMTIKINGVVEGPSSEEDFSNAFLDFIESRHWYFLGITMEETLNSESGGDEPF